MQHEHTRTFCKKLVELGLLQPVQAQLNPFSGERRVLNGLRVVNRNKLKELDSDTLSEMVRADELELAYLQLCSLANFSVLGERLPKVADDTAPVLGSVHSI
ncbi:hypothetical protein CKO29_16345 [Allochromatium vinosum]|nr:hypothetical protein [Allochromatium vinosum]